MHWKFWLEAGILDVWHIEGEDYLAFRHMTFQEYAVAYMLAEAWKKTPQYTWVHTLRPILHHYAWREPILLLVGLLDTPHLNDLVYHLLRGPSPYERYLHRDLRLAAALLGEVVALDTGLSTRIICHLGVADSQPHCCLEGVADLVSDLSCGWCGDMEPPSPGRYRVMGNPLIVVAVWWHLILDADLGVCIRETRFSEDSNLLGSSVTSVVGNA